MRALAALGLTRIPALPDLPTVAEQGFPGFKITNRYGLYAPAGTPQSIINAEVLHFNPNGKVRAGFAHYVGCSERRP